MTVAPPVGALIHYDAARKALQIAATIDEVADIHDKMAALGHYARLQKDTQMEVWCAEIKTRAKIKFGLLSSELSTAPGTRSDLTSSATAEEVTKQGTLASLNVSTSWAAEAEKIAGGKTPEGRAAAAVVHEELFAKAAATGVAVKPKSFVQRVASALRPSRPAEPPRPVVPPPPKPDSRYYDFFAPIERIIKSGDPDYDILIAGGKIGGLLMRDIQACMTLMGWLDNYVTRATAAAAQSVMDGDPPVEPQAQNADYAEATFSSFWSAYPQRPNNARQPARASWDRALKLANVSDIMTGLARYQFGADPQYRPMAATWLNQRRWECEEVDLATDPFGLREYIDSLPPYDGTLSARVYGAEELVTILHVTGWEKSWRGNLDCLNRWVSDGYIPESIAAVIHDYDQILPTLEAYDRMVRAKARRR